MGAALSIPFLVLPSLGTVRAPQPRVLLLLSADA